MSRQYWSEAVQWIVSSGTAVANTGTETILVPDVTIPANYLQDGRVLRIRALGGYGTTGTPTLAFKFRWGGVAATPILAASGAFTTPSGAGGGASMTAMWNLDVFLQTRSNGSSGTLMTNGELTVFTTGTAGGTEYPIASGSTGGTTPVAVTANLTADTAFSFTALWGTAAAANSIQCVNYTIESLN